jgi:hypothetical protein
MYQVFLPPLQKKSPSFKQKILGKSILKYTIIHENTIDIHRKVFEFTSTNNSKLN